MLCSEIQIRDPYVVLLDGKYYLYGTTGNNCWGEGYGFDAYIIRTSAVAARSGPPVCAAPSTVPSRSFAPGPAFGRTKISGRRKCISTGAVTTCLPPSKRMASAGGHRFCVPIIPWGLLRNGATAP